MLGRGVKWNTCWEWRGQRDEIFTERMHAWSRYQFDQAILIRETTSKWSLLAPVTCMYGWTPVALQAEKSVWLGSCDSSEVRLTQRLTSVSHPGCASWIFNINTCNFWSLRFEVHSCATSLWFSRGHWCCLLRRNSPNCNVKKRNTDASWGRERERRSFLPRQHFDSE